MSCNKVRLIFQIFASMIKVCDNNLILCFALVCQDIFLKNFRGLKNRFSPIRVSIKVYTKSFGYFHIDKLIIFTFFFIKNTLDIDALHAFIYIINRNVE